jgi:hypothetical protein
MLKEPSGSHRSVVEGLKLLVAHPVISKMIVPERTRQRPKPDDSLLNSVVSLVRILFLIP